MGHVGKRRRRKHIWTKALQNPPFPGLQVAPNRCQLLAEVPSPLCLSYSPRGQAKGHLLQGLLIALRTPLQSSRSPGALNRCYSAVHSSCHFMLRRVHSAPAQCGCVYAHSCLNYPPRPWVQYFLTAPGPSRVPPALAGGPWKHPARRSGQAWGANPDSLCNSGGVSPLSG